MAAENAQNFLFQRIKELLPPQDSIVDTIADILHVSNDSAYRRIRGETLLVLDEAKTLCRHFNLSLDQLLNVNGNTTLFQTTHIHNRDYTFENFLSEILQQLQQVNASAQKEIIYLTKDLPIFLHFTFQPLFAFRYFFWMKSILQHPDFVNKVFSRDCLPDSIKALGKEILKVYNNIPSTEIWNTECINSLILQVEYYKDAGFFSTTEDIRHVYDALEETIQHLQMQVEYGCKFLPEENPEMKKSNFKFFYNRIILGDNTILVRTGQINTVYIIYNTLNYMATRDDAFCERTDRELQNLLRRSSMISHVGEKQRNMFFNILMAKIRDRKENL